MIVFISYRRDDSRPSAERLHKSLTEHFGPGQVFMDEAGANGGILAGEDFRKRLDEVLRECRAMIVVIGPSWVDLRDRKTGIRRIDDPEDYVRLEILAGLSRKIPVVVVEIDAGKFPAIEKVPADLRELCFRQRREIRFNPYWDNDVAMVCDELTKLTSDARSTLRHLTHDANQAAFVEKLKTIELVTRKSLLACMLGSFALAIAGLFVSVAAFDDSARALGLSAASAISFLAVGGYLRLLYGRSGAKLAAFELLESSLLSGVPAKVDEANRLLADITRKVLTV